MRSNRQIPREGRMSVAVDKEKRGSNREFLVFTSQATSDHGISISTRSTFPSSPRRLPTASPNLSFPSTSFNLDSACSPFSPPISLESSIPFAKSSTASGDAFSSFDDAWKTMASMRAGRSLALMRME